MSTVELRAVCEAEVSAQQAPLKARQSLLMAIDTQDSSADVAALVKLAARATDPTALLKEAAEILMADDRANLVRELAESAARSLEPDIDEMARKLGIVNALDYKCASLIEQATKVSMARVQSGPQSYAETSIERHMHANAMAIKADLAIVRDAFGTKPVETACSQLAGDIDEFVSFAISTETI